jgi:hypothetical protein
MASITLTIPDAQATRVLNALATQWGYLSVLPDGTANPQTKAQFVKAELARYCKRVVVAYEAAQAAATQSTTSTNEVDVT